VATDAYAQGTQQLGVALVTTGPGGTNALTGVAASWLDSTPCLFLSGQVKRADLSAGRGVRQMGFQEIDVAAMAAPVTKYAKVLMEPQDVRKELEKAVHLATTGRPGPVWLDIPLDVQGAMIDERALEPFVPDEQAERARDEAAPDDVARALATLQAAERPVVLVGNGVRLAGAQAELLRFVEAVGIPVLTTWKAMDLIEEEHPLFIGRPGAIGQRAANFAQQNSDWFLSLGARLDYGQTGYEHPFFARGAKKIIVDVDPSEIAKLRMPVEVGAAADARSFLRGMLEGLKANPIQAPKAWLERCREWKARYPVVRPEYWEDTSGVNHYVLLDALSEALTPEDVVVPGSSGACSEATMQTLRVKRGVRVFNSQGLGPMGFGLPATIGGCLAMGRRRTLSVDGDGGFIMNVQELETLRRLGLPVKIFVLCNDGYASIRASQTRYFEGRFVASDSSSGLTLPSMGKLATAFGLRTLSIEQPAQVRERVAEALEGNDPVIVEVKVPATQETRPRLVSRMREDGSMRSLPLEDLYPFLDRDEFRANMIVPPIDDD
jgi:acetolactate synthase-1/2/3 large subunit